MIPCKLTHSLIIALTLLAFTACLDDSSSSVEFRDEPDSSASDSSTSNSNSSDSGKSGKNDTFNKDIKYGSFTDKRDNEQYKTVTIGTQTWMAENMRYKDYMPRGSLVIQNIFDSLGECPYGVANCDRYSQFFKKDSLKNHCPDDMEYVPNESLIGEDFDAYDEFSSEFDREKLENCQKYGRLYSRKIMNDICPDGWHLPSDDEWQQLIDFVEIYSQDEAGTVLKSKSKWKIEYEHHVPGKDLFGFNMLPVENYHFGTGTCFWSSSKHIDDLGDTACQSKWEAVHYENGLYKLCSSSDYDRFAIRCIKDADKLETGTITDSRDNKKYKTVKIGEQTWMAENLNFDTEKSYCPEDNCESNSRLYTWDAAKEACPDGYYLPSDADWNKLFETIGGASGAAGILKAADKWPGYIKNSDIYGFSIVPSGFRNNDQIKKTDHFAFFWSSSEQDKEQASHWFITDYSSRFFHSKNNKDVAYSVRCIKGTLKESSADTTTPDFTDPSRTVLGTFIDKRDGQEYATTTIGSQTWMAENLNLDSVGGTCFECEKEKYGYIYFWGDAVDSTGRYSDNAKGCGYGVKCNLSEKVRGICPEGWHLPKQKEWRTLIDALGGPAIAADLIRTIPDPETWEPYTTYDNAPNLDYYGFDLIDVGYKVADPSDSSRLGQEGFYGKFMAGYRTHFWTADEIDATHAYVVEIRIYSDEDEEQAAYETSKRLGGSVRCLKD